MTVRQRMQQKRNVRRQPTKRPSVPKKPAGRVTQPAKGVDMSNRVRRDLKDLKENIAEYSNTVEQRLAKTGTTPHPALVASAAKYFLTLKKLADK
jgi:hypothetical protein